MWFFSSLLLAYKHDVLVHRHLCILRIHRPGREEFPGFLGQIPPIREGGGGERRLRERVRWGKGEKEVEGGRRVESGRKERNERGRKRRKEEGEINSTLSFGYLTFILSPKPFPPSFSATPSKIFMLLLYPRIYLQDGEVLKHAVHHVSLREVLQPMDETDHVVTHRRTVNTINKPTIVKSCILSLEKRRAEKNLL